VRARIASTISALEQTLALEGVDFAANPKLPAAPIRDLAALAGARPASR